MTRDNDSVRLLPIQRNLIRFCVDGRLFMFLLILCRNTLQTNLVLNMCVMVESKSTYVISDYNKVAAAVDLGLQYVHEEILPQNITIQKHVLDAGTSCEDTGSSHIAALSALNLHMFHQNKSDVCHVYLGPGCSQAAIDICNIADIYSVPVIAIPAGGVTTLTGQSRSTFPMLIRMTYTVSAVVMCIAITLKELSFTHIVVFVDMSIKFYRDLADALNVYARHGGWNFYSPYVLEQEISEQKCTEFLKDSKKRARALVLLTHANLTRQLMLMAKDLDMTDGGYVFLALELFVSSYWGWLSWTGDDGRDDDAKQAFNSLIVLAIDEALAEGYRLFEKDYISTAETVYKYNFSNEPLGISIANAIDDAFYDAVILYANAVKVVHETGQPVDKVGLVLAAMKNCRYSSPITVEIVMDPEGDRYLDYIIMDTLPNGNYETVLAINGKTWQWLRRGDFSWPGGIVPVDMPNCGYDGMDPKCTVPITVYIIATFVVAALVIIAAVIGKCLLYAKKRPNPSWWKISVDELDIGLVTDDNTRLQISKRNYRPTSGMIKEINTMKSLQHANLVYFIGICLDEHGFCRYILEEFSEKGSLQNLINDQGFDDTFKFSFLKDIAEGMIFLHASLVGSHGFLTSQTCYVNLRFIVKVSDYGITVLRTSTDLLPPKLSDLDRNFKILLWRAPEHLRETMAPKGSQKGDVYSYAIIMQEVITHSRPFFISLTNESMLNSEIKATVMLVKRRMIPPVRPKVQKGTFLPAICEMIERCWEEQPVDRPSFTNIRDVYTKSVKSGGYCIIDLLLRKMEEYEKDLKAEVARKTEQFVDEKTRSDQLLRHMLPKAVADLLTNGEPVLPQTFPSVTILFSDIINFSEVCTRMSPVQIIDILNDLYSWADNIMELYHVYKVEIVAETFMVASGLPVENGTCHVTEMANLALQLRRDIETFRLPQQPSEIFRIRTGMHSGPCVAGIIGLKMPRYCLFGDSVNTASRMQSTGEPMKIQVTSATRNLLEELGGFWLEERGQILIKGKGNMTTFWLRETLANCSNIPRNLFAQTRATVLDCYNANANRRETDV